MLSPETAADHKLSPSELGFKEKPVMSFGIARTTNHTGEQLHVDCPVYADDTREDVMKRMGFCFSIIQERLETENRIVNFRNECEQQARFAAEIIKRNEEKLEKKLNELNKQARKQKWTPEVFAEKRKAAVDEFESLNKSNEARLKFALAERDAGERLDKVQWYKDNGFELEEKEVEVGAQPNEG